MLQKKYISFILILGVISSTQAAIVTHDFGKKEEGRIGKIDKDGFEFFGERLVFLRYYRIIDIQVDPKLTGAELDKEKKAIKRISLLLDKEKTPEEQLGTQVRKWLKEGKYDQLDSKAALLNSINARWPTGRWQIYSFYEQITDDLSSRDISEYRQRLKQIEAWIQKNPKSTTAQISLMHVLIGLAWAHRGSGYSNTVTNDSRKKLKENLKKVTEIGSKLRQQKTTDLMAYNYLISAENALGAQKSVLIELAKESSKINPEFYLPYIRTLNGLLPKWGGKPGESEKFSRWVYQLARNDSPEIVFQTHRAFKKYSKDKNYASMHFRWGTIQRGFENFRKTYHINDSDIHLMAKLACLHGNKEAARNYFAQTDGSWNYLSKRIWDNEATLNRFINWANTKENTTYKEIINAFLSDNFKIYSLLVESVKSANEVFIQKDIFGNTMLHNLADTYAPTYLDKISSIGINLNIYNDYGYTALHLASRSGRKENVEILLNNGADALTTRQDGRDNAAHMAAKRGFTDVLSLLLDKEPSLSSIKGHNGSPPLHKAAWGGYLDAVKFLVSKSRNEINIQDDYMYTPLHYAVDRGHEKVVRFLIEQGADTSLKNNKGHTALSFARAKNFDSIVGYLKSVDALDAQVIDNSENINRAKEIYKLSDQYFNKKDYKKAKEIYFKALEYYPDYYLAYAALAQVALEFEKDYIQADKYFDKSIKLNPEYPENYYWKGRVNFLLNKPSVYKPLFSKYVKLAPDTYNSRDLKKNWPHLLNNDNLSNTKNNIASIFLLKSRENLNSVLIGFTITLLILLVIWRRTKNK